MSRKAIRSRNSATSHRRGDRTARSHFGEFFVSAPAGLVILDSNLRVVRANATIAEMIGVSLPAILGRTPHSLAPDLAPVIEPLLRNVLSTKLPTLNCPITGETPKRPGVTRSWIASLFPVGAPDATSRNVGAIVVEVTDSIRLEQARRRGALLAEAEQLAGTGSWDLDLLGGKHTVSPNFSRLLGFDPTQRRFTEEELWAVIHPSDRERVRSVIDDAMRSARPYEYQARFVLRGGAERIFQIRGRPVVDAKNRVIRRVGVTQDITELKRTEELLRRREHALRGMFQIARCLTQTLNLDAILDALNLQTMTVLGSDCSSSGLRICGGFSCRSFVERFVSKAVDFTWPEGMGVPGWVLQNRRSYMTNDCARDPHISPEFRESYNVRNLLFVPIFDVPKKEVIAFFSVFNKPAKFDADDLATAEAISEVASIAIQNALTYQKTEHAERQSRRLSAQLMTAREEERKRIARALHEGTAQDLTGLKLQLAQLRNDPHLNPSGRAKVNRSRKLIEDILRNVRSMSYDLYPPLLELGGLWVAIRSHADTFARATAITVSLAMPERLPSLPPDQEIAVFRIFQECLTNVHHHSGSKHVRIGASLEGGTISLEVSDDGRGLPQGLDYQDFGTGLGVSAMRERARELGGELELRSEAGVGTLVRLRLPFTDASRWQHPAAS